MPSYVIITPVRNESERFGKTIDSMIAQTIRPSLWVIVDDGSTDDTGARADAAAKEHDWIRVIHRPDRGCRKQGGGVIEAFYDGFSLLNSQAKAAAESWEFIGKLDGDLAFEPDYFEKCFRRFQKDARLGIAGGTVCRQSEQGLVAECNGDPDFHVRGAVKIYRRACWDQISGLVRAPGWDTIDELKANMLGWETGTFKDIKVHQLKETGSADGAWANWVKNGRANYLTGYHPVFMVLKCASRFFARPYGVGALGLLCGYVGGYMKSIPKVADEPLVRYVRQQQMNRLFRRQSLWK